MSRGRVVNVRVTDAGLEAFDAVCKTRGVRRSEGWRQAMREWMRPSAGMGTATPAAESRSGHQLSAAEWKQWLWLNDFAEKCYLAGEPVKIGANLEGLRFTLAFAEDPDLAIP